MTEIKTFEVRDIDLDDKPFNYVEVVLLSDHKKVIITTENLASSIYYNECNMIWQQKIRDKIEKLEKDLLHLHHDLAEYAPICQGKINILKLLLGDE